MRIVKHNTLIYFSSTLIWPPIDTISACIYYAAVIQIISDKFTLPGFDGALSRLR